jgi:hypothetical protein
VGPAGAPDPGGAAGAGADVGAGAEAGIDDCSTSRPDPEKGSWGCSGCPVRVFREASAFAWPTVGLLLSSCTASTGSAQCHYCFMSHLPQQCAALTH